MSWIGTFTGQKFRLFDPRQTDICIEDIAHALSNQCRFNGHTREFYSVAQHSVHVSELVGKLQPESSFLGLMQGLLHDASEAYIGDMVRPLKRDHRMKPYRIVEDVVQRTIFRKFDLGDELLAVVRRADDLVLIAEVRDLMASPWDLGYEGEHVPHEPIDPLPPRQAEMLFMDRYRKLVEDPREL